MLLKPHFKSLVCLPAIFGLMWGGKSCGRVIPAWIVWGFLLVVSTSHLSYSKADSFLCSPIWHTNPYHPCTHPTTITEHLQCRRCLEQLFAWQVLRTMGETGSTSDAPGRPCTHIGKSHCSVQHSVADTYNVVTKSRPAGPLDASCILNEYNQICGYIVLHLIRTI